MLEYSAILQSDFRELFTDGIQSITSWLADVPVYWYIIALVLFISLVRLLTGKKTR